MRSAIDRVDESGLDQPRSGQKICSPRREPWDKNTKSKPAPAGAEHPVDVVSSFAALRLSRWLQPYPRLTLWATDLLPLRGCG